jgi:hypothetical protein
MWCGSLPMRRAACGCAGAGGGDARESDALPQHEPSEEAQETSSPSHGRLTAAGRGQRCVTRGLGAAHAQHHQTLLISELDAHNSALSRLRARCWSGGMADNNRRSEHPICGDANKQEDRDHDRRNEVFHACFLLKTSGRIRRVAGQGRPPACRQKL